MDKEMLQIYNSYHKNVLIFSIQNFIIRWASNLQSSNSQENVMMNSNFDKTIVKSIYITNNYSIHTFLYFALMREIVAAETESAVGYIGWETGYIGCFSSTDCSC